jgi:hypothetical protein
MDYRTASGTARSKVVSVPTFGDAKVMCQRVVAALRATPEAFPLAQ